MQGAPIDRVRASPPHRRDVRAISHHLKVQVPARERLEEPFRERGVSPLIAQPGPAAPLALVVDPYPLVMALRCCWRWIPDWRGPDLADLGIRNPRKHKRECAVDLDPAQSSYLQRAGKPDDMFIFISALKAILIEDRITKECSDGYLGRCRAYTSDCVDALL
jgi:hypothetical protein